MESGSVHLRRRADHETHAVCWVVTVSDTRTPQTDTTGRYLRGRLTEAGHRVSRYTVVKDDASQILQQLEEARSDPEVQAVILHGGTGLSRRDATARTVKRHLDEEIEGFGELFRMISYQDPEVGPFAWLSRAVAGLMADKLVFALPGSENAVRTATEKLLLPVLAHAVYEVHKDKDARRAR